MKVLRAISTLWIPVLSLIIGVIIYGVGNYLLFDWEGESIIDFLKAILFGVFGSIVSFVVFGILFWPPVILLCLIVELLAINKGKVSQMEFQALLIIETIIIAIPFIYWAHIHSYLSWYYFIMVFAIGQYLRLKFLLRKNAWPN